MIGQIQTVQTAKSGNSLRVQIGGEWYSAKHDSGLTAADVGKNVTFMLDDTPFPPGSTCYWVKDYQFETAGNTPSGQAMNMAVARSEAAMGVQATVQTMTQDATGTNSLPNKDSLIGALALVKSMRGSREEIWESFVFFYYKLEGWDSSVPF